MHCSYASYSDIGGRNKNEDRFLTLKSKRGYLFVVADGLGGQGKGEVASEIVVEELKRQFCDNMQFDLKTAICDANQRILYMQEETGTKMKTTVSVAWIEKKMTHFAHVGDSRIYAIGRNGIVYQSVDHSVAQMAVASGEITKEEIRNHVDRNRLTRALGQREDVKVELFEMSNKYYKRVLLCTDGFWEHILEEDIFKSAKSIMPRIWLNKMIKMMRRYDRKKSDNNTAITVRKRGG